MIKLNLDGSADLDIRKTETFLIQQVTESIFGVALLTYNNYIPKLHDIKALGALISAKELAFSQAFLLKTEYNKHILDLLRRANIDSRYNKAYQVSIEELVEMAKRIRAFQALTEKLCKEKIASFASQAEK